MREDHEMARLLSGRDRLSVLEKEAVFARVVGELQPPKRRRLATWLLPLGSVASVLCAALWLWGGLDESAPAMEPFQARGDGFGLELRCEPEPCRRGGRVVLRVEAPPSSYVAVFAQRSDGTIVWYVPAADQPLLPVPQGGPLGQAILLDAQQPPGTYRVFAAFVGEPLSRHQLKAQLAGGLVSTDQVQLVERALQVHPSVGPEAAP